jgi:hypothetical protein
MGALQPVLIGEYVHVVPPSFEYSITTVTPAGSVADVLASLYCTDAGSESTTATLDALAPPTLVTVDVNVRFVPGIGVPAGLTAFAMEMTGRMTVTTNTPLDVFALLPTERPVSLSVSITPLATLPTLYVTVTVTVPPFASAARRALSGFAPCVMLVPVIDTVVSAVPGFLDVSRS